MKERVSKCQGSAAYSSIGEINDPHDLGVGDGWVGVTAGTEGQHLLKEALIASEMFWR